MSINRSIPSHDHNELIPIVGCGCCIFSFFGKTPDCIGCAYQKTFLCIYSEAAGMKPLSAGEGGESCFHIVNGDVELIPVKTFIKGHGQFFCLDTRVAIPCDADVPVLFNLLGITCWHKGQHKIAFCSTLGNLEAKHYTLFG